MQVAIVGAGIVGRLMAVALHQAGAAITLFDRSAKTEITSCSMTAAGLLTPLTELIHAPIAIYQLGMAALNQHWPTWLSLLGNQIYFKRAGSLWLAHPRDLSMLRHGLSQIAAKLPQNSFYQSLNSSALQQLEPELDQFSQAYYLPTEGQLDNQELIKQLGIYLESLKVSWLSNVQVDQIEPHRVFFQGQSRTFDWVIDCRGLGAKSHYANLQGVRGEIIRVHAPEVTITRPVRFYHPRYPLYIVPRPHHQFLLGASEILSESNEPITVRTTLELLSAAYYVHSGFAEAQILACMTQCRPTLPDYLPQIRYQSGYVGVNGLYRHGYLIAPSLVADVCAYLTQGIHALTYSDLWSPLC